MYTKPYYNFRNGLRCALNQNLKMENTTKTGHLVQSGVTNNFKKKVTETTVNHHENSTKQIQLFIYQYHSTRISI
jgi:hypothetical protein